jgi:Fe-S-cluster-containing hydrogenase component 2
MVCPFGAIRLDTVTIDGRDKKAAIKCDLCVDRTEGPACVDACPTKALSLKNSNQVIKQASQATAQKFLKALEGQQELANQP